MEPNQYQLHLQQLNLFQLILALQWKILHYIAT